MLARPSLPPELLGIIRREVKKQKIPVYRMRKQNLIELARVTQEILERGCPKNLVVKKLNHNLGHGIFLHPGADPIFEGQVIASYGGVINFVVQNEPDDKGDYSFAPLEDFRLSKEEQRFWDKKNLFHPSRLYALKLDALKKGNFTRFINHSEKPNIYSDMLSIPKNPYGLEPAPIEIVYFAKKTIYPGEQLLISYEAGEKSYWNVAKIKPFPMTPKTFRLPSAGKLISKITA